MDLDVLKTFITVAEHGSFSIAADRLFLTQPAVSKRIAALEKEFNTRLFDRIGKLNILTEAGERLIINSRRILAEVEESHRVIANLSNHVSGKLKLGISHHIGLHRLPPVLRTYTKQHPQVQLDIRFLDSEEGCLAVEHGKIEMALVTLPSTPEKILRIKTIWDDPLAVLVNESHPLNTLENISLSVLAQHPAILPAKSTFTRRIIEKAFHRRGTELNVIFETNYLETIRMMVSVGLGWSILPLSMQDKELKAIPVDALKLVRRLGVVLHNDRTPSNAANALLNLLEHDRT